MRFAWFDYGLWCRDELRILLDDALAQLLQRWLLLLRILHRESNVGCRETGQDFDVFGELVIVYVRDGGHVMAEMRRLMGRHHRWQRCDTRKDQTRYRKPVELFGFTLGLDVQRTDGVGRSHWM